MAISKKLEIIYHNGQPDGIRSIRRHLSTMTTSLKRAHMLSHLALSWHLPPGTVDALNNAISVDSFTI